MTSFSIVSLILVGKKEEPVIFSISGEEKSGPTLNDKPFP